MDRLGKQIGIIKNKCKKMLEDNHRLLNMSTFSLEKKMTVRHSNKIRYAEES